MRQFHTVHPPQRLAFHNMQTIIVDTIWWWWDDDDYSAYACARARENQHHSNLWFCISFGVRTIINNNYGCSPLLFRYNKLSLLIFFSLYRVCSRCQSTDIGLGSQTWRAFIAFASWSTPHCLYHSKVFFHCTYACVSACASEMSHKLWKNLHDNVFFSVCFWCHYWIPLIRPYFIFRQKMYLLVFDFVNALGYYALAI